MLDYFLVHWAIFQAKFSHLANVVCMKAYIVNNECFVVVTGSMVVHALLYGPSGKSRGKGKLSPVITHRIFNIEI